MNDTPKETPNDTRPSMMRMLLIAGLMVVFSARVAHVAWTSSPTFDEPKHLSTGLAYLASGVCCLGRDNTPMVAWSALPLYLEGTLPQLTAADAKALGDDPALVLRRRYFAARLMQLPLVWLLCFALYRWMRPSFGFAGAALALALLCVDPNVTAFAALVSPDFQVVAFLFAASVAAAPLVREVIGVKRIMLVGLLTGCALLAKYTALVLAPALVLGALLGTHRRANLLRVGAALAIAAALVVAAYELPKLTQGVSSLSPPHFADRATQERFASLADAMRDSSDLGFVAGLSEVRRNAQTGFPVYFFGHLGRSFAAFYPSLLLFKTPLSMLLLIPFGLVLWLRSRARRGVFAVPGITTALVVIAAITSHFNLGLRHILVVAPLGACLAACALVLAPGAALAKGLLVALAVLAGCRYHPRHLAYFNELIGGPGNASRFYADSSIDWGQDLWLLRSAAGKLGIEQLTGFLHVAGSPAEYGVFVKAPPRGEPPRGWCAVSLSRLHGLGKQDYDGYRLADLFHGREPVARIGDSILLYLLEARAGR